MRSVKQVFFDHLAKQRQSRHCLQCPTMEEVQNRVQELVRGTVRDMWPIIANEQSIHQMQMLLNVGLREMITERFIYNGGCDILQIVDGRLLANINIVPIRAVEWITINFTIGEHGRLGPQEPL